MNRIYLSLAGLLVCGLCLTFSSMAQEKKEPNVGDPAKGAKETEKTKALRDLELASRLINYGRANKHAESLLIAAQIIHKTPTQKLNVASKATGGDAATKVADAPVRDDSPKALVAEAKKLSPSAHVAGLANATLLILDEESRGVAGGPMSSGNFVVRPGVAFTWDPITYIGLQSAIVHVNTGTNCNMLLEVFDQFGNRVAADGVPGNYFRVSWTPRDTGTFTIRLTNRDTIALACNIQTN